MNILDIIKNNLHNADNPSRKSAYTQALQENNLLPLIQIGQNGESTITKNPNIINNDGKFMLNSALRSGIADIKDGYRQNIPSDTKNIANHVGGFLNNAVRFADTPLARGLATGGLVALNGGSGLDALTYGLGTASKNQSVKSADRLYRQRLSEMGYSDEDINALPSYVNGESFKNVSDNIFKQQQAEIYKLKTDNERIWRDKMIGINQQKADIQASDKNAKNFISADEYYSMLHQNRMISDKQLHEIISAPDYDSNALINLNGIKSTATQNNSIQKSLMTEDNIKTNKQNRAIKYKNGGKNVMRIEYGNRPNNRSTVDVYRHDAPSKSQASKNTKYADTYEKFKSDDKGEKSPKGKIYF